MAKRDRIVQKPNLPEGCWITLRRFEGTYSECKNAAREGKRTCRVHDKWEAEAQAIQDEPAKTEAAPAPIPLHRVPTEEEPARRTQNGSIEKFAL